MRKYVFILLFTFLFIFVSYYWKCTFIENSFNNSTEKFATEEAIMRHIDILDEVERINSKDTISICKNEIKYYADNMESVFLECSTDEMDAESIKLDLYLNDHNNLIYSYYVEQYDKTTRPPGVIWINNSEVIIDGNVIFDMSDYSKEVIILPELFGERKFLRDYAINPGKNHLAALFDKEYCLYLYLYDMNTKTWVQLCKQRYEYEDTSFYASCLSWITSNEIYFVNHNNKGNTYNLHTGELEKYPGEASVEDEL